MRRSALRRCAFKRRLLSCAMICAAAPHYLFMVLRSDLRHDKGAGRVGLAAGLEGP